MTAEYLEPFVQGVSELLGTMLGESVRISTEAPSSLIPELTSVIELTGRAHGALALSFPESTARGVVAAMLGEPAAAIDANTVADGAEEFANIVAGYAKARLSETPYHFQLTPPRHHSGPWAPSEPAAAVVRLESAFGDFLLQIRLTAEP